MGLGPSFLPQFIIILLFIINLGCLLTYFLKKNNSKVITKKTNNDLEVEKIFLNDKITWLCFIVILLAIPVTLNMFGFKVGSVIIFISASLIIKYRSGTLNPKDLIIIIVSAVALAFIFYNLFEGFLRILLPRGIIFL